jgi:hypothetical protein
MYPHVEIYSRGYSNCSSDAYASEAARAVNNMIPECIHEYGLAAAQQWFTNLGLEAYTHVKWDPTNRSTTSQQDCETRALVEEDLFGIGTNWKIEAPIMKTQTLQPTQPQNHSNTTTVNKPIHQALESCTNANNVHSFGSVFGRMKDNNDTITTTKTTDSPAPTITNPPSDGVIITFDAKNLTSASTSECDAQSFASSTGLTQVSTRSRLREEQALTKKLLAQLQEMAAKQDSTTSSEKTTVLTSQKLKAACKQLELLQKQPAAKTMSPWPQRKPRI